MPHCSKCGTLVSEGAAYCPNCGQAQSSAPGGNPTTGGSAQSGLTENVAALLSYVLGWLTGIIFLLIDKRPFVRFHAAQSLVVFGGLHILRIIMALIFGFGWMFGGPGGWAGFGSGFLLRGLIGLLTLVLWVVLMVKAYQHERFKVPLAGDLAENIIGK